MSEIKVNKISPATGTETTLGDASDDFLLPSGAEIIAQSGSTITIASGATLANAGTATGFAAGGWTQVATQATTSGSEIFFTGIPSDAKVVALIFDQVSTNGSGQAHRIELGDAGGYETSGYSGSTSGNLTTASASVAHSSYFPWIDEASAGSNYSGVCEFRLQDLATNTWTMWGVVGGHNGPGVDFMGGAKSLSGALTSLRVYAATTATAFDNGSISLQYMS
jgi:hypothetical protein